MKRDGDPRGDLFLCCRGSTGKAQEGPEGWILFWRKTKNIEQQIEHYMLQVDECMELFLKAMRVYLRSGRTEEFETLVTRCHSVESAADDLRRDIEMTLYGRALLPESRGDILGLLESFDRVPNGAEKVLFMISCERLDLPSKFADEIGQLVDINMESYGLVRKSFDALMNNPAKTLYAVKEVDDSESRSDRLERKLIGEVFDSDYSFGQKLQLKELIITIGNIANRSENTADRIGIVAIKRRV